MDFSFFTQLFANPMVALAVIITIVAGITIMSVAQQCRYARIATLEANLKRQMLDKGLSPGAIEQVLRASQMTDDSTVLFTGEIDADKAALVKLLTENDYSGSDIARVLTAFARSATAATSATIVAAAKAAQGMIENGKEAEEIEQMLHAFHGPEMSGPAGGDADASMKHAIARK